MRNTMLGRSGSGARSIPGTAAGTKMAPTSEINTEHKSRIRRVVMAAHSSHWLKFQRWISPDRLSLIDIMLDLWPEINAHAGRPGYNKPACQRRHLCRTQAGKGNGLRPR